MRVFDSFSRESKRVSFSWKQEIHCCAKEMLGDEKTFHLNWMTERKRESVDSEIVFEEID